MLILSPFSAGMFLLLFAHRSVADRIVKIGNDIRASASGIDVTGATFLMNDEVRDEGIIFAFSAFFRTDSPLRFQIWRPVSSAVKTATSFRLITELRTIPSVVTKREDVYIASRMTELCTRVIPGDRLGILFEGPTGSVSYKFDSRTYTSLADTLEDSSKPHVIGEEVFFGTLTFPYDFSASAYIDINLKLYSNDSAVTCPQGLYIPYEDIGVVDRNITEHADVIGEPGATGATGLPGRVGPTGDPGATGPAGATGSQGMSGGIGPIGSNGPPGQKGGPGPNGHLGGTGATGPRGQRGPAGPPGLAVTLHPIISPVTAPSATMFSNPEMIMSFLIWLIALTIVTAVLVVFVVLRSRRKSEFPDIEVSQPAPGKRSSKPMDYRISGLEPEESWMSTLKEQSHHDVYLDTVDDTDADKEAVTSFSTLDVKINNNINLQTTPTGSETELMASDTASYELKNY